MENKAVRWWSITVDHDGCNVSSLASHVTDRSVVSQHGILRADRTVFPDGNLPFDTFLRHVVHGTAWLVALSESLRGCGLL